MASIMVLNLQRVATSLLATIKAHGEEIAPALERLFEPVLHESESLPNFTYFLDFLGG